MPFASRHMLPTGCSLKTMHAKCFRCISGTDIVEFLKGQVGRSEIGDDGKVKKKDLLEKKKCMAISVLLPPFL